MAGMYIIFLKNKLYNEKFQRSKWVMPFKVICKCLWRQQNWNVIGSTVKNIVQSVNGTPVDFGF